MCGPAGPALRTLFSRYAHTTKRPPGRKNASVVRNRCESAKEPRVFRRTVPAQVYVQFPPRELSDDSQAGFREALADRLEALSDDGRTMGSMASHMLTARKDARP